MHCLCPSDTTAAEARACVRPGFALRTEAPSQRGNGENQCHQPDLRASRTFAIPAVGELTALVEQEVEIWRTVLRGAAIGVLLFVLPACGSTSGDAPSPEDAPSTTASNDTLSSTSSTSDAPADEVPTSSTDSSVTAAPSTASATTLEPVTTPAPKTTRPETATAGQEFVVVSITDGDTIRVIVDGVEERLRLIGINAPEGGECMAAEATALMTTLLTGKTVRLESDVSNRDQFDRLLRYVYVDDVFVNEVLVRQGLALARRYEPDTGQAELLQAAQTRGEGESLGMWAPDACGVPATGDIRVGAIHYDADGNDNDNLNDEWAEISNVGPSSVDLTGWVVKDESASHRYSFPFGFMLPAGTTVRLYTGCGDDTDTSLYWCNTRSAVWNNSGDTVFILDPSGNIINSKSY